MQTPNIRFGKVYGIHSRAFDAGERAKALVVEKQAQGIEATVDKQPRCSIPEESGMHAIVYTNEGDNALDCYQRLVTAKKAANEAIGKEFPYLSGDEKVRHRAQAEMTAEQQRQHMRENSDRLMGLIAGGQAAIEAANELVMLPATPLYFDEQGQQVDQFE